MSETCRRPSGDSQGTNTKIDHLMKKLFLDTIALVLHLFLFLQEEQIFKNFKQGRVREVYGTQLRDIPGTK